MNALAHARGLLAILAPCGIILAVRFISGLGPSASSASVGADLSTAVDSPAASLAAAATAARAEDASGTKLGDYIAALRRGGKVQSPMDHPPIHAEPPQPEAAPATDAPVIIDRTELRLSATLGAGPTAAALINGKLLHVGDSVAGLTVKSIDAAAFIVVLTNSDGDERILRRR